MLNRADATIDLRNAIAGRTVLVTGMDDSPDVILEIHFDARRRFAVVVYRNDQLIRLTDAETTLPRVVR